MNRIAAICLVAGLLVSSFAVGEIRDADTGGFTTVHEVIVDARRDEVWASATAGVATWWNPDHTVSGDSSRLVIEAVPQGCFCERLGDSAGVVHLTVTMVNPGVILRMTGGLGPLGLMGVNGNMTWEFESIEDSTRVVFTYAVGGYRKGGLDELAAPVDAVIGEALLRLKSTIEIADAEATDSE